MEKGFSGPSLESGAKWAFAAPVALEMCVTAAHYLIEMWCL